MTRKFHLGDVLSVMTGVLVSPRHIEGVYDVLGFMHGTAIWTHQIPRACQDAIPFIHEQRPALKDVDASSVTPENWRAWLDEQVRKYGAEVELSPIPNADELRRNPVDELVDMVGPDRVIVLDGGAS